MSVSLYAYNMSDRCFIHPIHRFKSSDWLKGHMAWISFDNVHVGKLTVCVSFYFFPLTLGEAVTAAEFETFTVRNILKNP